MNDSPYGLTASVWTNAQKNPDFERAFLRIVDELQTGTSIIPYGAGRGLTRSVRSTVCHSTRPHHHPVRKRDKLIRLLDVLDCTGKHRQTSLGRQSDTCMWLHITDEYMSWKEGQGSLLWLQGKGMCRIITCSFL